MSQLSVFPKNLVSRKLMQKKILSEVVKYVKLHIPAFLKLKILTTHRFSDTTRGQTMQFIEITNRSKPPWNIPKLHFPAILSEPEFQK